MSRFLLVWQAFVLLWKVRLGLWLVPYDALQRRLEREMHCGERAVRVTVVPLSSLLKATKIASRLTPRATCLTQALAARALLARYNHPSDVRIGVAKAGRALEAHAWLVHKDRIILGNLSDLPRYRPLRYQRQRRRGG